MIEYLTEQEVLNKISGFVAVAYGMLLALVLKRVTIRVEVMGVMTLQRNT